MVVSIEDVNYARKTDSYDIAHRKHDDKYALWQKVFTRMEANPRFYWMHWQCIGVYETAREAASMIRNRR